MQPFAISCAAFKYTLSSTSSSTASVDETVDDDIVRNEQRNVYAAQLRKCTQCRATEYCSDDCQRRDWRRHRSTCRRLYTTNASDDERQFVHTTTALISEFMRVIIARRSVRNSLITSVRASKALSDAFYAPHDSLDWFAPIERPLMCFTVSSVHILANIVDQLKCPITCNAYAAASHALIECLFSCRDCWLQQPMNTDDNEVYSRRDREHVNMGDAAFGLNFTVRGGGGGDKKTHIIHRRLWALGDMFRPELPAPTHPQFVRTLLAPKWFVVIIPSPNNNEHRTADDRRRLVRLIDQALDAYCTRRREIPDSSFHTITMKKYAWSQSKIVRNFVRHGASTLDDTCSDLGRIVQIDVTGQSSIYSQTTSIIVKL